VRKKQFQRIQLSGVKHNSAESVADLQKIADAMDLLTLKEDLRQATMPFEYIHRAESCRLEGEEEANKIWT